jgi:AraC family transcriptional regulator
MPIMNASLSDDLVSALDEDIPAALPGLIDAAVAAFDADRDRSLRYLLRASALVRLRRRTGAGTASSGTAESRGGLVAWQLNRLVDYIETHLAEKITAQMLADLIHVSPGQLFRAFKVSVGVTPFQHIMRRRVELACSMMRTTQESLSQIAIACGLCDQSHFCRVFRRVMGMSPSTWRRSIPTRKMATPAVQQHAEEQEAPGVQCAAAALATEGYIGFGTGRRWSPGADDDVTERACGGFRDRHRAGN